MKMWGEGKTGLCVDNSLRMHLDCFLSSCILHFHEGAAAPGQPCIGCTQRSNGDRQFSLAAAAGRSQFTESNSGGVLLFCLFELH